MAHAATALRWQYGEIPAVVTSIGPGAMQAYAGALAAASNGVGVYHIYGDETTFGEGYNMQQVPKEEQGLFGQMTAILGRSYTLHTPEAIRDALRRGAMTVNHPYRARPFFLLLPLNTQPAEAAAQPCGTARAAVACRRWRRPTTTISTRPRARSPRRSRSRSRPAAARAVTTRPCAASRKRRVPPSCCRPARPACCPMPTRRTCTWQARRARSAATSRRPMPSC